MKPRKTVFALLTAMVLLLLVSQVHANISVDWIHGTVTSEPISVTYGIIVYSFNFQADSSSLNGQVDRSSTNLTCLWLSQPVLGATYNFSGVLITADSSSLMPIGVFFISSVNAASNTTASNGSDWTWTFRQIWSALGTVGNLLATFVVQIVQTTTGYSLSLFMASLLVLFLMGAFFLFLGKHLPWYIDLIGFIVFIAVCSNLFSTL